MWIWSLRHSGMQSWAHSNGSSQCQWPCPATEDLMLPSLLPHGNHKNTVFIYILWHKMATEYRSIQLKYTSKTATSVISNKQKNQNPFKNWDEYKMWAYILDWKQTDNGQIICAESPSGTPSKMGWGRLEEGFRGKWPRCRAEHETSGGGLVAGHSHWEWGPRARPDMQSSSGWRHRGQWNKEKYSVEVSQKAG